MDEQSLEQLVAEAKELRFTGTDDHGVVTITTDGAGKLIEVRLKATDLRRLPVEILEAGVLQAFGRARDAAAAENAPVMSALRDQNIDPDTLRKLMP